MKIRNFFNPFQAKTTNFNAEQPDWPEPEKLRDSLLPVTPLPIDNIPEAFREWIIDVAERMQCPLDFIAVASIVVTASVIGASCGIKPKQKDDWLVIPNLWGGIVGHPGMLKSPAVNEVMQLLGQLEKEAKKTFDAANIQYQAEMELYKADKDAIKAALVNARKEVLKNKSNSLDTQALKEKLLQIHEPAKPIWRRYKTNDTTIEKLSELLADNPRGLMLYRDELMGLVSTWDKEGREGDRAFFLEAWNGDGSQTTDRITRGTVHTENLCISILGNTQPAKLYRYLHQAIRGLDNDGLLQRFQLLIYPDKTSNWKLIDRAPNIKAKQRVSNIITKLAEMDVLQHGAIKELQDRFAYFRFNDAAQDLFNEWLTILEKDKLQQDEQPILLEHFAKYRSLVPCLALIFHLINVVDGKTGAKVNYDAVLGAIAWCGYLENHARRIYGMMRNTSFEATKKLANKIQNNELPSPFSLRDIYRKEWSLLDDKELARKACNELVDANWLRMEMQAGEIGRPKLPIYFINPKVKIRSDADEFAFTIDTH